ncbi:MAG: F0F1 ATP synthase subunit B [Chloroflexota bacterium]
MAALGINIGYLIMQIAGIIILMSILNQFAYKPILNVLEQRKERIAKGLEDARQAAQARDNADSEARKILEEARAEAASIRSEAASAAEDSAKKIVADAGEEARKIKETAAADGEKERDRVLADLRSQVAAISMAAANRLVGEALDEKKQRSLISDFFSKVPDGITASGGVASITSALPLTDDELKQVKSSLKADSVEVSVDPDILGGLIVRVGDQIVDNSVASQMSGLASSLK